MSQTFPTPQSPLELDMPTILKATRAAFDAGQLQAQTTSTSALLKEREAAPASPTCLYSGPCAIGAAIPEEIRPFFDKTAPELFSTSIPSWVRGGYICFPSGEQQRDAATLQADHDDVLEGYLSLGEFEDTLTRLEAKYGQPS